MDTVMLANWLKNFQAPNLPTWEEFPDFELYMDQLVSLGNRYLDNLTDSPITSSMVNSYVKKGLMARPDGKLDCKIDYAVTGINLENLFFLLSDLN